MVKKTLILLALLTLGAIIAIWDIQKTPKHISNPSENVIEKNKNIVPNALFTSIEGTEHYLHDYKGKIVLLNIWASWCVPCIVELPELLDLAEHKQNQLVLIALSVDEDLDNIKKFTAKLEADTKRQLQLQNVVIAHDPEKKISQDLFQTISYPETFIIGPDLTIANKIVGVIEWNGDDFINWIDTLLDI